MFCNQCEQTAKKKACTIKGVCGKSAEVAILQDELMHALRMAAFESVQNAQNSETVPEEFCDYDQKEFNTFLLGAVFATLTNVNFDPAVLQRLIQEAIDWKTKFRAKDTEDDKKESATVSMESLHEDPVLCSAMQTLFYGVKGLAAYAYHVQNIKKQFSKDMPKALQNITDFIKKALILHIHGNGSHDVKLHLDMLLECGMVNMLAMEELEKAHVEAFGHPEPTKVALGQQAGKAILISGHDLGDLYALLQQTEGKGIHVYTHGEMLPAHAYPALKAFAHLKGHYGTAWQNQKSELPVFPGAIVFTSNCIQDPGISGNKYFTCGSVAWPNVEHCNNQDFSKVIDKALELQGFASTEEKGEVTVGFGRKALSDALPKVVEGIKNHTIQHIFLVGGCDGAALGRDYYTEFVEMTPQNTLILTLACGKFRFFSKNFGVLDDIPRLLDVGQCNDAFAAIKTLEALASALECSIQELPVSIILSWYEQKAVSVLLSLLALNIRDIRLGPSLPAFIAPQIWEIMQKTWNIKSISSAREDLEHILQLP